MKSLQVFDYQVWIVDLKIQKIKSFKIKKPIC